MDQVALISKNLLLVKQNDDTVKFYNLTTRKEIKPYIDRCYYRIHCNKKFLYCHRLIVEAFSQDMIQDFQNNHPNERMYIDHIDEDKLNNKISNLQCLTNRDNIVKSIRNNPRSRKEKYFYIVKLNNDTRMCFNSISQIHNYFKTNNVTYRASPICNQIRGFTKSSFGGRVTEVERILIN